MIIGLTGKSGAGKDTAAAYLVRHHGFGRIAFADKLKHAAREIFGFNHDQLHGDQREVVDPYWGVTPRSVLQLLGTECVRDGFAGTAVGKDIWVRAALRDLMPGQNLVFTDVRFCNEAKRLTDIGGKIVRIVRPCLVPGSPHQSESEMDSYPCPEIYNDGLVCGLESEMYSFMRGLK